MVIIYFPVYIQCYLFVEFDYLLDLMLLCYQILGLCTVQFSRVCVCEYCVVLLCYAPAFNPCSTVFCYATYTVLRKHDRVSSIYDIRPCVLVTLTLIWHILCYRRCRVSSCTVYLVYLSTAEIFEVFISYCAVDDGTWFDLPGGCRRRGSPLRKFSTD